MKTKRILFAFVLYAASLGVAGAQYSLNVVPSRVFGHPQVELKTTAPNLVEGRELFSPLSVAIDASVIPHRIYVADTLNNRVLGWSNAGSFSNGQHADIVIGQKDFFSTIPGGPLGSDKSLSSGLFQPTGVAVDTDGNLFVADAGNNRILRYKRPFEQSDVLKVADMVIGQPSTLHRNCATMAG